MRFKNIIFSALMGWMALFSVSSGWAADPSNGAKLYAKQCIRCHGSNGTPVFPGVPDFKRSNVLIKADKDLVKFIMTGSGMMPAYQGVFEEKDILDIIAYLRTLH